jgi:hypothetical protein
MEEIRRQLFSCHVVLPNVKFALSQTDGHCFTPLIEHESRTLADNGVRSGGDCNTAYTGSIRVVASTNLCAYSVQETQSVAASISRGD